jgi:dipeptidyl aminopeptidase/acylaminoacyl peptidase
LLIHGTEDRWVPLEQSRRLDEALAQAGATHQLLIVPGARHGFGLTVKSPQTRNLIPEILAFLENVWQVTSRKERESALMARPAASKRVPR